MKKLTQAVFEQAPDWVKSAAVDGDGDLFFFGCKANQLVVDDMLAWFQTKTRCKYGIYASNYDTTDWQDSALDKE